MRGLRPNGTRAYVALRLFGQSAEFALWIVLARRLRPAELGVLTIGFLIARYSGLVADWGAITRGARDVASPHLSAVVPALLRHRTRVTVALVVAFVAAAAALGHAELAPLAGVIFGLGANRDWLALGRGRPAAAGLPLAVQGALLLGGAALPHTVGQASALVGASYAGAALLSVALNPRPEPRDRRPHAPVVDGWMLLAFLSIQLTSTADTVLLGVLASPKDAGVYSAAYRLPNAVTALLTALLAGLLPRLTAARADDPGAVARLSARALRASRVAALGVLALTPVVVVVFPWVFGDAYASGRAALVILMIATAVITLSAPLHPMHVSVGHDRSYAMVVGAGAAVNTVLNLALIPTLGAVGAATSTLVAQVLVAGRLWRLRRADLRPVDAG